MKKQNCRMAVLLVHERTRTSFAYALRLGLIAADALRYTVFSATAMTRIMLL